MSKLGLEYKLWHNRMRDNVPRWIAWHLPKRLVMWCYMRVGAHATTGKYGSTNVSELSMMDAIDRFSKDSSL